MKNATLNLNNMKTSACIIVASLVLAACNNSEQEQRMKTMAARDSIMTLDAQKKDSSLSSYIASLNEIQDNLDSIKHREKLLTTKTEGGSVTAGTLADIKSIDNLILKDNREIASLQSRLRKMNTKDANLEKLVAHLTREVAEKDSDLVALQASLAQVNTNLQNLTQQFNDSLAAIKVQRTVNNSLQTEVNTVYYAVGTLKELKKSGVIEKKGGIAGLGGTPRLKQGFNKNYFTMADKTKLASIPLYSKFSKVVTDQPGSAFTVKGTTKSDSLVITDADKFWSESKYLVVVVK